MLTKMFGLWLIVLTCCSYGTAAEVQHFWDFEGAGPYLDRVGMAHGNVTVPTTVTTDAGHDSGQSMRTIDLVDIDDYVDIDDSQFFQPMTGDFSMSYWFNMEVDQFDDPRGLFDFSGDGMDGVQSLYIDAGGNADNLAFRVDGTGGAALALTPFDFEDGDWHFVAATYSANGTLSVHADGVGVDASVSTSGVGNVLFDVDSYLGTFNFKPEAGEEYKGLNGRLDDFAIYSGVLTNDEIGGLFAGTLSPTDIGGAANVDADFNDDGALDCLDIDALIQAIASNGGDLFFDLTGDGLLNLADRDAWLTDSGVANLASGNPHLLGDANLDGAVDVSDFNAWNASKFTTTAAWCSGDFNADGVVDVADFNEWNARKFTSADRAAVPEPVGMYGWVFAVFLGSLVRRRMWSPRSHSR